MSQVPLIEIEGIRIYRNGRNIVGPLSLRLFEGEHTALLGPNGCGKSTLIRVMTRELYSHAGEGSVRIQGKERWLISQLRTIVGVVSNEPREELLGEPTGLDMAISGLIGTYGVLVQHTITPEMVDRGWEALRRMDAERLAHQPVETMSAGEHRRCFIARALVSRPKALILDEPTTGLDIKSRHQFMKTIQGLAQEGTTIVLVTHHLEEVFPEITRTILMRQGQIVADGQKDVVFTPEKIAETFEIDEPNLLAEVRQVIGR